MQCTITRLNIVQSVRIELCLVSINSRPLQAYRPSVEETISLQAYRIKTQYAYKSTKIIL